MSLNQTPSSERIHIAFFGRRNAGKSSLINAVTAQQLSIVSDVKGTTTDPVQKAMELLPLGPVVVIDTPGLDDEGELGKLRVEKSYQVLAKTDFAILVIDATIGKTEDDQKLIEAFQSRKLPYLIAWNKADSASIPQLSENEIAVSAQTGENIHALKELLAKLAKKTEPQKRIVSDLISAGDFVVLVVPIDEAAPKGRLILPQQQTIRDILDAHANAIVVQTAELSDTLKKLGNLPKLVICDSQAFGEVQKIVPDTLPLTSFSILFARYKGNLRQAVEGANLLDCLQDGDRILISEGCTHHRQCNDIGAVKLPNWILGYTQKKLEFSWTSGGEFPKDLSDYRLIIHCGGCMLNEQEMQYRLRFAKEQNIPMTNYGIAIAKMNGILERSIAIFEDNF